MGHKKKDNKQWVVSHLNLLLTINTVPNYFSLPKNSNHFLYTRQTMLHSYRQSQYFAHNSGQIRKILQIYITTNMLCLPFLYIMYFTIICNLGVVFLQSGHNDLLKQNKLWLLLHKPMPRISTYQTRQNSGHVVYKIHNS